jgi:hypothetical protein
VSSAGTISLERTHASATPTTAPATSAARSRKMVSIRATLPRPGTNLTTPWICPSSSRMSISPFALTCRLCPRIRGCAASSLDKVRAIAAHLYYAFVSLVFSLHPCCHGGRFHLPSHPTPQPHRHRITPRIYSSVSVLLTVCALLTVPAILARFYPSPVSLSHPLIVLPRPCFSLCALFSAAGATSLLSYMCLHHYPLLCTSPSMV